MTLDWQMGPFLQMIRDWVGLCLQMTQDWVGPCLKMGNEAFLSCSGSLSEHVYSREPADCKMPNQ